MAFFRTFSATVRPRLAPLVECAVGGVTADATDATHAAVPGETPLRIELRQEGGAAAALILQRGEARWLRDLLGKRLGETAPPPPINRRLDGDRLFAVTVGGQFRCRLWAKNERSAEGRAIVDLHIMDEVLVIATPVAADGEPAPGNPFDRLADAARGPAAAGESSRPRRLAAYARIGRAAGGTK